VTILFTLAEVADIDRFMFANMIRGGRSEAIRELIRRGLRAKPEAKNKPRKK
jgi:hypothetical protein